MDCPLRKKTKQTAETETENTGIVPSAASSDDRVGRVVTVVVSDRKRSSKKTAKKTSASKTRSKKTEKPALETADNE